MTARLLETWPLVAGVLLGFAVTACGPRLFARLVLAGVGWVG